MTAASLIWAAADLLEDFSLRLISYTADRVNPAQCVDFLHCHLVLGEGAGLVRTDDGGRAQGFNRRQVADDGAAAGHARDADRQRYGQRRGQSLRDSADRQGNCRHERIHHRLAAQHADAKGQRR